MSEISYTNNKKEYDKLFNININFLNTLIVMIFICYKYNHKFYLNNKIYKYIQRYSAVLLFTYHIIIKSLTLVNKIILNAFLLD